MPGPTLIAKSEFTEPPAREPAETTAAGIARLLLRHWKAAATAGIALAAIVVLITLMRARSYTAGASFVSQTSSTSRSGLSSLAAQIGFELPTSEASRSPAFFADLLRSRAVLRDAV